MNWDAIGAIGEMVGAGAVVITLAVLTVQIRQSAKAARAQTKLDVNRNVATYLLAQTQTNTLARVWVKAGKQGYDALDPEEEFVLRGFAGAIVITFRGAYEQFRVGTISMEEWEGYRTELRSILTLFPAMKEIWDIFTELENWSDDFVSEVVADT